MLTSTALALASLLPAAGPARAQDATWLANPGSADFNTGGNWSTNTVPTGTAHFGASSATSLTLSAVVTNSGGWTFDAGASAYTFTNDQILNFNGGGIDIQGGSAAITNTNTLTFSNASTAGSATIINTGTVMFFVRSTSGDAQLINNGASAVIDFSGSTGPNNDNRLSAGSIAGDGAFRLGRNELTVGANNLSTEVSGVISDGGSGGGGGASLVKTGTGTLTLSGANTYTGDTTVDGGRLDVNGSIATSSVVFVNPGATLGGTGTVAMTFLDDGATLAPGTSGSIGTLNVTARLLFCACSTYAVKVSATDSDRTTVNGIADLAGVVRVTPTQRIAQTTTYTILSATTIDPLAATFDSAVLTNAGGRNARLSYIGNDVLLTLDAGFLLPALPGAANANQRRVAGGIDNALLGGANMPAAFNSLFNLPTAQLGGALDQISGEVGTAITQPSFNAMQQFMTTIDQISGNADGARGSNSFAPESEALNYAAAGKRDAKTREAYAAVTPRDRRVDRFADRWGVWAAGYGGSSTVNGNTASGASTTTSRIYGGIAGADYRVSPDTRVGFALGGAGFNFALADGLGNGRADLFQAGVYGRHTIGAAYISATLAYGWQDVTTDRTVTVSGTDKLAANFKASTFAARAETGWRFTPWPAAAFGVTPYAALQAMSFILPGYGESATSGSNQFALSYSAQTTTNVRTELGTRVDKLFALDDGRLTLRGKFAWAHDSNTDRPVTAAFQTLPGAAFTINGARPAADSALVAAGAEMTWRNGISLGANFEGEFSSNTRNYTGKGTLRYAW